MVHLISAVGQRAGSGMLSGEQPWASNPAFRAAQGLQRVPGLPLGQQQQHQIAGSGYLPNRSAASLPSELSQAVSQKFYDLNTLRLQQQANNLQQQYQASLLEARLRAQPQPQHLRYPFPSSEASAGLAAYPLNNLANYARAGAGVNDLSSLGIGGMQASGIHQNANYFRLQGSGQHLAAGASRNLQSMPNLPSNIPSNPNNNTAQSSWATSTNRVDNIPPTQPTDSSCKLVYVSEDDHQINPFQRFARQQMEFFAADEDDLHTGCQGRNKPIQKGQVGIRCIHCATLPPKAKARSACYYPSRLDVLYQAAQNIINVHLPTLCESIPDSVRSELIKLDHKRSKVGGGKNYWKEKALEIGVIDTNEDGLRFREPR